MKNYENKKIDWIIDTVTDKAYNVMTCGDITAEVEIPQYLIVDEDGQPYDDDDLEDAKDFGYYALTAAILDAVERMTGKRQNLAFVWDDDYHYCTELGGCTVQVDTPDESYEFRFTRDMGDDLAEELIESRGLWITQESFGSELPENWEEIRDALNAKMIRDRITEKEDLDHLWERWCSGELDDVPAAQM